MSSAQISAAMIDELRAALRGPVLLPGDPAYDEVAPVHNASITTRPQVIARCVDAADVMAAVSMLRGVEGIDVAVRGGGHNGAGLGTSDGVLLDLGLLADGSFVRADAGRDPDLFWALRGGGGNFGIVTEFSFRLHPVGIVAAGPTLFPIERAAEILSWYREFLPTLPREMGAFFASMSVPP